MESITTFLTTNYVYVIGGGLILLIMLIGLVAGKSRKKVVKEEKTVDFKDVNTGSITDVVDVNAQPAVAPVEVAQVATPVEASPVIEIEQPTIAMPIVDPIMEPTTPVEVEIPMMDPAFGIEISSDEIPSVLEETPITVVEEPTIVTTPVEEVVEVVDPLAGAPTPETKEPLVDYSAIMNENQEEVKVNE